MGLCIIDSDGFKSASLVALSWGYADQPPLVPALAGWLDTLFPHSLVALRLPSTLTAAASVG